MKKLLWFLILAVVLNACKSPAPAGITPSPTSTPAFTSTPSVTATPTTTPTPPPPDPRSRAGAFLDGWKAGDYPAMHALLTASSQASKPLEDFTKHFSGVAIEAALDSLDYEILAVEEGQAESTVRYRVTFHSNLVPDVQDETAMKLNLEDGQWRIVWEDTIVMSRLSGANYLSMNRADYTPPRGNIYDRNGNLMAGEADAYAVGLDMLAYDPEFAEEIINPLARLSGIPAESLEATVKDANINAVTYLSLGEYPAEKGASWEGALNRITGAVWNTFHSRFYFGSPFFGSAPHVLGYVGQMEAAQVENFRRQGFAKDELIGQSGLEQWAESYLLGKRGGALYVRNENNNVIEVLAEATSVPSQAITTTLDLDFQVGVQRALWNMPGAAVVLERDTGRILAMASSPGFDPNAFAPGNLNAFTELTKLGSPLQPLYNRATQGQYPLGSVFKIVTISAGLESGIFTAESTYDCKYAFTDVTGITLYDWTWDHFQEDQETLPSGNLTLPEGLIRSCNPWFYHIGHNLYVNGKTDAITKMAQGFGLGSLTGLQGVSELPGAVPTPDTLEEELYLAIGQGGLQVTPLQVASFVAAVGNGGTLYTPQVIERIAPDGGGPAAIAFEPKVRGTLPVSPENLKLIQDAMLGVTTSRQPLGTAYYVFRGFDFPIHGKTGTAQTGVAPHAWFAAYSNANLPNRPDIAVAVIVENGGEGSEWAAPITRRIFELYFLGRPGKLYPWESGYYIWETPEPTPDGTLTPTPEGEED